MFNNSRDKRVLIFGGIPEIYKCLLKKNVEVCAVHKDLKNIDKSMEASVTYYEFDYRNLEQTLYFVLELSSEYPIDAIITFTEDAQETVAAINESMGLSGISSKLAKVVKDKSLMRNVISDFSPVKSDVVMDKVELLDFVSNNGFPLILKPKDGVGSRGIKLLESFEDIKKVEFEESMMVEEYLMGKEFSIESFSSGGVHKIIAVTEKRVFNGNDESKFVEEAHLVPAILFDKDENRIIDYVIDFLNKIDLRDGPAHTEIILTKTGPKVIETHTRPGGDYIPELVKLSTGIDIYELAIDKFVFNKEKIQELKKMPVKGAAIKFFTFSPGKVIDLSGLEEAAKSDGIVRLDLTIKPGDYINPVKRSGDRCGYVIATGEDAYHAYERCLKAAKLIKVTYDSEEVYNGYDY